MMRCTSISYNMIFRSLVLTKEGARSKSVWELPACFQNEQENFTHSIKTRKTAENGNINMQTYGRGDQEFYISDNSEVVAWSEDLLCHVHEIGNNRYPLGSNLFLLRRQLILLNCRMYR